MEAVVLGLQILNIQIQQQEPTPSRNCFPGCKITICCRVGSLELTFFFLIYLFCRKEHQLWVLGIQIWPQTQPHSTSGTLAKLWNPGARSYPSPPRFLHSWRSPPPLFPNLECSISSNIAPTYKHPLLLCSYLPPILLSVWLHSSSIFKTRKKNKNQKTFLPSQNKLFKTKTLKISIEQEKEFLSGLHP